MIELMLADADEIDVMRQTDGEIVPGRHGRYLDQGNSAAQHQVAQQRDVQIQSWNQRIRNRLASGQEERDLVKQVISQPDDPWISRPDFHRRNLRGGCGADNRLPVGLKRQQLAIQRNLVSTPAESGALRLRNLNRACPTVDATCAGAIDQNQLGHHPFRYLPCCQHHIIRLARAIQLPRSLKELEELFDSLRLMFPGNNANHSCFD